MSWDQWKDRILGGRQPEGVTFRPNALGVARPATSQQQNGDDVVITRQSRGLEQFFSHLGSQLGLSILDFGSVSQANVAFVTDCGHRLYSLDFQRSLDEVFGVDDPLSSQADQDLVSRFLAETFHFPDGHFDGILVWDSFEYLAPPLLLPVIDRIFRILKENGCLLSFFHSGEKPVPVPAYWYRIADERTLLLTLKGHRLPVHLFNNRGVESLFNRFQSLKFFLTRDQLREVFVRR